MEVKAGKGKMRILIVNSFYYPEIEGGAELSVKMLAEKLAGVGHDVFVLCTGVEERREIINNVHVIRFRSHCISRAKDCITEKSYIRKLHRILDVFNPFNCKLLRKYVDEIGPDVIHTNGLYDISPVIWSVAKRKKVLLVHTLRDYYLICEHGNMLRRKTGAVCERPRWICRFYRLVNAFFSRNVNIVTAPSAITLNTVCDSGLFKKAKKEVVFNAADLDLTQIRKRANQRIQNTDNVDVFNFVFLGALSEHKGIKWLIESFYKIDDPRVRLIIAGKGPLEAYVRDSEKRDGRIIYKGFLNHDEIAVQLKDAYMLICPSLWNEPFGRVVLDAYQMALPVIATDLGALPYIVCDRLTGYIVNSNDRTELLRTMQRAVDDRDAYAKLVDNIADYSEQFTLDYQVEQFAKLYTTGQE